MDPTTNSWFTEQVDAREMHQFLKDKRSTSFRTKFQQVEFHHLNAFGRTMVLDGAVQSSEEDEHIFHECLVHPAMLLHPEPKNILILGGGEGATLREVLKHPSVEKVTMVDIDGEFVEFCKKALSDWNRTAFEDPRSVLIYTDGREFLTQSRESYDVIITDITDILIDGPAIRLYTKEFYELCASKLTDNGVISLQALELSNAVWEQHATLRRTLKRSFRFVESYSIFVPSFTSNWGFIIASNRGNPVLPPEIVDSLLEKRGLKDKLFAYDSVTHTGLFAFPKDLRNYLSFPGSILEDGQPLRFFPKDTDYVRGLTK